MVLQVGAVRHRMPEIRHGGPGRPQERRAGRSHRTRGDAPAARTRCGTTTSELELVPHPGLDDLDGARGRRTGRRAGRSPAASTGSRSSCRPVSTSPPTASCRRGSPTRSSTPTRARPRWRCTTDADGPPDRGARRRPGRPRDRRRPRPRPGRHRRAGEDLRRRDVGGRLRRPAASCCGRGSRWTAVSS